MSTTVRRAGVAPRNPPADALRGFLDSSLRWNDDRTEQRRPGGAVRNPPAGRGAQGAAGIYLLACAFLAAAVPQTASAQQTPDVPYVVTPMNVVEAMLEIAEVGPKDYLIDLGSGDGRIVIAAAKKRGAHGLGIELDGALVNDARREAARQGVSGKVEFREENLFITELGRASVLTTYLFPRVNIELRPRIFAELKPGSRVVSHEFDFGNWKPDAHVTVKVPNKPYGPPRSEVFLWIVPANAAGRWEFRLTGLGAPAAYELTLEQTFQELRGSARMDGKAARLENPRLRGDRIRFTLIGEIGGAAARREFSGIISGDSISGKARVPHAESGVEWKATRVSRGKINIDAAAGAKAYAASVSLTPAPLLKGEGRSEVRMH